MNKKINDFICAIMFLIAGIIVLIITPKMTSSFKMDDLGSRFFPYAIGVCTILVSLILGGTSLLTILKSKEKWKGYTIRWVDNLRAILYCLAVILSVFLFSKVHFLILSFVMTTALLALCKERKLLWYLIVYACTLITYFAFTMILHVRI